MDRDERPDIDSRYQVAVASLTGQGGWPLTAFLTADGKPFYGGTYFPPADAYGRPSFKRVLLSIAQAYREKQSDVVEQAHMVENAVARSESFSPGERKVSATVIDAILESAQKCMTRSTADLENARKFPHPGRAARPDHESLCAPTRPCHSRSGFTKDLRTPWRRWRWEAVYDQLAGEFPSRYSAMTLDRTALREKSDDNFELLKITEDVMLISATGDEFFAVFARDTIRWMQ